MNKLAHCRNSISTIILCVATLACAYTPEQQAIPSNSAEEQLIIAHPVDDPEASTTPMPELTFILDKEEVFFKESEISRWKCGSYPIREKTQVEVGRILAAEEFAQAIEEIKETEEYQSLDDSEKESIPNLEEMMGFVLYDGTNEGEFALYHRKGLDHRWDWGQNLEYTFVIKANGTGLFYDFSSVGDGEERKADSVFSCDKY